MSNYKINGRTRKQYSRFKSEQYDLLRGFCPFCNVKMTLKINKRNSITIDHIKPKSKGGSNSLSNVQVMCSSCNNVKRGHTQEQFVKYKMWMMDKVQLEILHHQLHCSRTGDVKALRALSTRCLGRGFCK